MSLRRLAPPRRASIHPLAKLIRLQCLACGLVLVACSKHHEPGVCSAWVSTQRDIGPGPDGEFSLSLSAPAVSAFVSRDSDDVFYQTDVADAGVVQRQLLSRRERILRVPA